SLWCSPGSLLVPWQRCSHLETHMCPNQGSRSPISCSSSSTSRKASGRRTAMTAHPTHPDPRGNPHLLLIVPSSEGERQAEAMETWIQACADDEPFALELVGT